MSRDLILIALSLVTWGVGEGMFLFFQPLYLQELGASPVEIGGILGLVGIAMSVAHLPAGYLSDRLGRRPLLIVAWMVGMVAAWTMALARTLPVFVAGSALYGMTSFVIAPLNSYVTAARGNWSVSRAISLISASFNLGAILGPLLGGWIGSQFGLRFNFLAGASIFFLSTGVIFFIGSQPLDQPEATATNNVRNQLKEILHRRFRGYLALIFLATFCMYLPQSLSANFLQNERGVTLVQIGRLLAARSLGVVTLNLLIGQLNPRSGYLISQAIMGAFTILLWRGFAFPWYLAAYFLMGGYMTARVMASAQGRALVGSSNMGLAYGTIETVGALAVILAPPVAGFLYNLEPVLMYPVSLALIGMALASTAILLPKTQ